MTSTFLLTQSSDWYWDNAPINVKPEGGGGGGRAREFDCGAYLQGGDFDRTSCI